MHFFPSLLPFLPFPFRSTASDRATISPLISARGRSPRIYRGRVSELRRDYAARSLFYFSSSEHESSTKNIGRDEPTNGGREHVTTRDASIICVNITRRYHFQRVIILSRIRENAASAANQDHWPLKPRKHFLSRSHTGDRYRKNDLSAAVIRRSARDLRLWTQTGDTRRARENMRKLWERERWLRYWLLMLLKLVTFRHAKQRHLRNTGHWYFQHRRFFFFIQICAWDYEKTLREKERDYLYINYNIVLVTFWHAK